jgi:phosphatidylinositol-3-phosphatase
MGTSRAFASIAVAVSVAALQPAGTGEARTTGLRLAPVADLYVSAAKPRSHFGTASQLVVAGRPASTAYLRFRAVLPEGAVVTRATLRLFVTARSAVRFTVHRVADSAWSEAATTYANAPAIPARPSVSSVAGGSAAVVVDVTPLVTGGGLISLAVRSASAPFTFASREAGAHRPQLVVVASDGGTRPCGTARTPAAVNHVIWIWMENKSAESVIGSPSAPYENQLAAACGLATNYHAVAHPSLPNYIAATSGSTQGIADDESPSVHPLDVASIYSQLRAAGKTWRDYSEGAPGACPSSSVGRYVVRHDPALYYTNIRNDCAAWDVPLGTTSGGAFLDDLAAGRLPALSVVTPDLCNDTHDCPVATGDAWLASWFARILASPAYRAGDTAVFVVWDEDDGSASNHVPLLVVSPSTRPGTRSDASFDHYSLLKTTEQLLGITTFLGHAGDPGTSSMLSAFNLG